QLTSGLALQLTSGPASQLRLNFLAKEYMLSLEARISFLTTKVVWAVLCNYLHISSTLSQNVSLVNSLFMLSGNTCYRGRSALWSIKN
ncbi:hypothetical protein LM592_00510, partial [Candidatus Acetothermia bacterium]|nr:hypothetical protein [Candidatus Acetothermia bacterium]